MTTAHEIKVRLRDIRQLFNSMDPSPFHEKDLDHDAEEFIVGWAREMPRDADVSLVITLDEMPPETDPSATVGKAIHNYFEYQAEVKGREFRELMRRGRASLMIGLVALAICITAHIELERVLGESALVNVIGESLLIAGWVAMWRPIEVFLYDWWPIRNARLLYERLSRMPVRVEQRPAP